MYSFRNAITGKDVIFVDDSRVSNCGWSQAKRKTGKVQLGEFV